MYWAGTMFRYDGNDKPIATFGIHLDGFNSGREATVDIVAGQPLEVILNDKPSNSSLRCYNPAAPDVFGAKHL